MAIDSSSKRSAEATKYEEPRVKRQRCEPAESPSDKFTIMSCAYGEKGVRKQMEDAHVVCDSLRCVVPTIPPNRDYGVYAVIDGHGGKACAHFTKDNILGEIANQVMQLTDEEVQGDLSDKVVKKILSGAFSKIDSRIATEIPHAKDGCCIILALVCGGHIYIANLGDCAAVLCRVKADGTVQAIPLSDAHKPWVIAEKQRVERSGGVIDNGRIGGILEVSRSLGDISGHRNRRSSRHFN